jgi:hypothetical protein
MAKVRHTSVGSVLVQVPFVLYSLTIVAMVVILVITPFRSGDDLARGLLVKPSGFGLGNFRDAFDAGLGDGVPPVRSPSSWAESPATPFPS